MNRSDDLNDRALQKNLRSQFLKDGFIFFPGFLDQIEISLVNEHMVSFIEEKVKDMPEDQVYFEDLGDRHTLKQLQKMFQYDPFFYNLMFGSRFEKLASILLDDKVLGKNLQYFNKPAQIGKATPAHQDGYYFMLTPNEAVTMWMALEPVDEENGCVRYIKGSHRYGMRDHGRTGTLGFSQGITDFGCPNDLENEVFFSTKPGDLLVHHSLTIHRADANRSQDRSRQAMGFIYYAARASEDEKAHKRYAEKLADELKKDSKI